jgi:hypothetical protein
MYLMRCLLLFALLGAAFAQSVVPPANDWPMDYGGSAFRGTLTEVSSDGMTFTLTFSGKKKPEVFTGTLAAVCSSRRRQDGRSSFTAANIPLRTLVTAFYKTETVKVESKKVKVNKVIALTVHGVEKPLDKGEWSILGCTPSGTVWQFKAFGGEPE